MFFPVVAWFAGGDDIAAVAPAAADYRHDVIHGKLNRGKFGTAPMTNSFGKASLPPLALAKFPRLCPLAADLLRGEFYDKIVQDNSSMVRLETKKGA
jgi:hypothetical protein